MSPSSRPTACPRRARPTATFTATDDFPTPPFPAPTATMCRMLGRDETARRPEIGRCPAPWGLSGLSDGMGTSCMLWVESMVGSRGGRACNRGRGRPFRGVVKEHNMSSSRHRFSVSLVAASLSVWLFAGVAQAQEKPAPPLRGPKVTPNRPPELEDDFAPGGKREKGMPREIPIPMRQYMQAVGKLRADDTARELRLTDDQEKKIKAGNEEFRQVQEAAQRKMREEMPDAKPGAKDEMDKQPADPGTPRRPRVEEARRNMPRPAEFETKIWNVLSVEQQKVVQGELDKFREEQKKRQGDEYMKREMEKRRAKDGKEPEKAGAPANNIPPGGPSPETRERVQRIVEELRSEERRVGKDGRSR